MKILLNNEEFIVDKAISLSEFLLSHNIESKGVAVAINNKVVTKSLWDKTYLNDNDKITVIAAAFGC